MNIVVVDDQPEYRLLLKHLLTDEGWKVRVAEDGEDALRALNEAKADIVITDIYMPVKDGLKLRQAMRGHPDHRLVPIIFVSAFEDEYTSSAVRDPKREVFLMKNAPPQQIIDWVRHFDPCRKENMNREVGRIPVEYHRSMQPTFVTR